MIPLGILILGIAASISLLTAWVSQRVEQEEITRRLAQVYDQLARTDYPLTPAVITQIENYSGVDIVLISQDGTATTSSLSPGEMKAFLAHPEYIEALDQERNSALFVLKDAPFRQPTKLRCFSFQQSRRNANYRGVVLLLSDPERTRQISALIWAPAISGMISVLVMMLVSSWIASRLAGRVENLEKQVKLLSQGAYDCIELAGPKDAIYRLSLQINSLSEDLKVAHEVIAKTERARLISLVASGMAHDIRNSLAGASLLLETYLCGSPGQQPSEVRMALDELQKVSSSVRRLLASDPRTELIDEPDLRLQQIEQTLREMVGRYAEHQQVQFAVLGFSAELLVPQGAAIANALVNLGMNAIEAAGVGGNVEIETIMRGDVPQGGGQIGWRVWDSGHGPPAKIAASMMEPFVSTKPEGVGLGLAMAKRVAQRCSGALRWFRTTDRTCFELMIPYPPAEKDAAEHGFNIATIQR